MYMLSHIKGFHTNDLTVMMMAEFGPINTDSIIQGAYPWLDYNFVILHDLYRHFKYLIIIAESPNMFLYDYCWIFKALVEIKRRKDLGRW